MDTRRYFKYDKNYILKEAQLLKRDLLLGELVERVIAYYKWQYNPLGLMDGFMKMLTECKSYKTENLIELYDEIAGIYRFQHGSNQLELLFDGTDHLEKYEKEWSSFFVEYTTHFCLEKTFLKAVITATIINPNDRKADLATNRLRAFVADKFGVKVYKHKGIVPMKVA